MKASRVLSATRRKLDAPPKIAILPPLPLYRRILRAHKLLPADLRLIGDLYAKQEFKSTKNLDNPVLIMGFLSTWQKYVQQLTEGTWREERLDVQSIDQMEADKVIQLYELMIAAQGGKSEYNIFPEKETASKKSK